MADALVMRKISSKTAASRRQPSDTETPEFDASPMSLDLQEPHGDRLRLFPGSEEFGAGSSLRFSSVVIGSQDEAYATQEACKSGLFVWIGDAPPVIRVGYQAVEAGTPSPWSLSAATLAELVRQGETFNASACRESSQFENQRKYESFKDLLVARLIDEPIEDGVSHPAEQLIAQALRDNARVCHDWISEALVEQYRTHPSLGASILRCVGRLRFEQVRGWGLRVVDDALGEQDVEVREAAVRALEAWGGTECLELLERHVDSVPWVNEYVRQVIMDITEKMS